MGVLKKQNAAVQGGGLQGPVRGVRGEIKSVGEAPARCWGEDRRPW